MSNQPTVPHDSTPQNPAQTSKANSRAPHEQLAYVPLVPPMEQLSQSAKTLNTLSDELTSVVAEIEIMVNKLNLGVRAEVDVETITLSDDHTYRKWLNLSYRKWSGKWGFFIEELAQDLNDPGDDSYECWAFKDAPRDYRLKTVEKIPVLFDALVKQSQATAVEIRQKTTFAKQFAETLLESSPEGSNK